MGVSRDCPIFGIFLKPQPQLHFGRTKAQKTHTGMWFSSRFLMLFGFWCPADLGLLGAILPPFALSAPSPGYVYAVLVFSVCAYIVLPYDIPIFFIIMR